MQEEEGRVLARLLRAAGLFERAGQRLAPEHFELTSSAQLEVARNSTGLDDFGHASFIDGMEAWFLALSRKRDVTGLGHLLHRVRTQICLTNRLYLQRDFKREREIMARDVYPAVFIIGPTRTGTTMLQSLLSLDPRTRSLLSYESFRPTTKDGPIPRKRDLRLPAHQVRWWFVKSAVPDFPRIHWVEANEPDECGILLANTFTTAILDATVPTPEYMDWFLEQDLRPSYAFYRDTLKLLQAQRSAERWVLKCPYHLWGLDALLELFPNAVFIQMHRRMDEVIPSTCSMFATLRKLDNSTVDPLAVGREVPARWAQALARATRAREAAPPERFVDVRYEDLVADPVATVRALYARFNWPFHDSLEAPMQSWLRAHPQNKRGRHSYTLEQFGLTPRGLHSLFGEYEQRFGVQPNARPNEARAPG